MGAGASTGPLPDRISVEQAQGILATQWGSVCDSEGLVSANAFRAAADAFAAQTAGSQTGPTSGAAAAAFAPVETQRTSSSGPVDVGTAGARAAPLSPAGRESRLHDAYVSFANLGRTAQQQRAAVAQAELNSKNFVKLCKQAGLLKRGGATPTDCDLIFTQEKERNKKTLTFSQFQGALAKIAQKAGLTFDEAAEKIAENYQPVLTATKTDQVRFHDDKSTFTGTHARGGQTTVDRNHVTLATLTNRADKADVRGITKSMAAAM